MKKRDSIFTATALLLTVTVTISGFGNMGSLKASRAADRWEADDEITQYDGYELVWNDEFDDLYLDDSKWVIGNTPENGSHKYNTATTLGGYMENENIYLEDGALQLRATPLEEPIIEGNKVYRSVSGMVETKDKASWRYGRFDIRAKLPVATGMWPAIWMMPDVDTYGWPMDGEIDIMELISQQPDVSYGTVHCGYYKRSDKYHHPTATYRLTEGTFYDDYHVFSMEWEPGVMRMYVDNQLYAVFTDWPSWVVDRGTTDPIYRLDSPHPFNALFYLKLNLATGPEKGWCEPVSDQTDWEHAVMSIDYVRVYKAVGKSYAYAQEAFRSSAQRQGPVWYAQKQGEHENVWENMAAYDDGWDDGDGVAITNDRVIPESKAGAIAFVVPEDGHIEVRLEQEAVSQEQFEIKLTKGRYSNVDSTFSKVQETLEVWEAEKQGTCYSTGNASEGRLLSVKADDVIRLEVQGEGAAVEHIEPVFTYKQMHTLSYERMGGEGMLPEDMLYADGTEVTVAEHTLTKEGYRFAGWRCGEKIYQPGDRLVLSQDEVLEAVWKYEERVKPPALAQVQSLRAVSNGTAKIGIAWNAVHGADGYIVSRRSQTGKDFQDILKTDRTSVTVNGLQAGAVYEFRVRAYAAGRDDGSAGSILKTACAPTKPKLRLKQTGQKVTLTWKKIKNASGYEVSMKTGNGRYKRIAWKGKKAVSLKRTLKGKKVCYFRIRACKKVGDQKIYSKYSAVCKAKRKRNGL